MTVRERMGIVSAITACERKGWSVAFLRQFQSALDLPCHNADERRVRQEQSWFLSRCLIRGVKSAEEAYRLFAIEMHDDHLEAA